MDVFNPFLKYCGPTLPNAIGRNLPVCFFQVMGFAKLACRSNLHLAESGVRVKDLFPKLKGVKGFLTKGDFGGEVFGERFNVFLMESDKDFTGDFLVDFAILFLFLFCFVEETGVRVDFVTELTVEDVVVNCKDIDLVETIFGMKLWLEIFWVEGLAVDRVSLRILIFSAAFWLSAAIRLADFKGVFIFCMRLFFFSR